MKLKFKKLFDLTDLLVFGGTALISYGCWLIYEPAAYLSGGAILLTLGWKGLE